MQGISDSAIVSVMFLCYVSCTSIHTSSSSFPFPSTSFPPFSSLSSPSPLLFLLSLFTLHLLSPPCTSPLHPAPPLCTLHLHPAPPLCTSPLHPAHLPSPPCTSPVPNYPPDVGYAQGMNDILTRFLVVTNSEVDSYWMFARYMERKRIDFLEETMMKKVGECVYVYSHTALSLNCCSLYSLLTPHPLISSPPHPLFLTALVKKLIEEIDQELFQFFEGSECQDYLFCHRYRNQSM